MRIVHTIDRELGRFDNGASATGARLGRPRGSSAPRTLGRRNRRGELKEQIIAVLKAGGKKGVHVKEIVARTGAKDPNVRVWFYATGKKIKNIRQIAPATYAWVE